MKKFRVGQIQVGDSVTIDNVKRKWRITKNAKFLIENIRLDDKTVFVASHNGIRYTLFLEHITGIFEKKEKVQFT